MANKKNVIRIVVASVIALCIPGMLMLNAWQSSRYKALEDEIIELEKKQEELVNENKKLIVDISMLSSTETIQNIAENQLGMRQAESDEIDRLKMDENYDR